MDTIQILHFSLLEYIIAHNINSYIKENISTKTRIIDSRHIIYSYNTTTYFIIKSMFLSSNTMYSYIEDIRLRSEFANIIIIGSYIDYDKLFRSHYKIFGVIDTARNHSLQSIRQEIHSYLDGIYNNLK
ncbi:hypothetical protein [Streptococcus mitis]|uniref:hypothetical protein n=1 Tax=Streptococcus mitis TaxID=28037 RepID=UPI001F3AB767|nr:hypothetical protein [Streptococcus mitis]